MYRKKGRAVVIGNKMFSPRGWQDQNPEPDIGGGPGLIKNKFDITQLMM